MHFLASDQSDFRIKLFSNAINDPTLVSLVMQMIDLEPL